MIKILLLCALFTSAFCTQEWSGLWSVVTQESGNYSLCDIPQTLSVVNITSDGENLTLEGMSAVNEAGKTWTLPWSSNQQFSSSCEDGWCVTGSILYTSKGIVANISWTKTDAPTAWCSSLLTPITVDWTGDWVVVRSQSADYCPVPTQMSLANIKAYGEQLLLVGNSTQTNLVSSWTLNFTSPETHVRGACVGPLSVCVEADLYYLDEFVVGSLTWVADNFYDCSAILIKVPAIALEMSNCTDLNCPEASKYLGSEWLRALATTGF